MAATIYLGAALTSGTPQPARGLFLPGATTDGHHQIELKCEACHTPFSGVSEAACLGCHGDALQAVDDSHPRSKFTDPRNAQLVTRLDARSCLTCHREHAPAMTRAMGVTRPDDYCVTCHEAVGSDRPTHAGLGFDTCATAGCHNYHDNSALYEDFLVRHAGDPVLLPQPALPPRVGHVTHEQGGVTCAGCHGADARGTAGWIERPTTSICADCHAAETAGFGAGKHGMRAAAGLPAMRPADARSPMRADAAGRELSCASCHPAHDFDTRRAAVDACLGCHSDRHSLAYRASPHARLWTLEADGAATGTGVSCATCHLPRVIVRRNGADVIRVEHNQNHNLQPNERMARTTCLHCHGLQFSLDALADRALIDTNFSGTTARRVDSLDMAMRRRRSATN